MATFTAIDPGNIRYYRKRSRARDVIDDFRASGLDSAFVDDHGYKDNYHAHGAIRRYMRYHGIEDVGISYCNDEVILYRKDKAND